MGFLFNMFLLFLNPFILLYKHIIIASKLCLYNFDPIFEASQKEITLKNYKKNLPVFRKKRADFAEQNYHSHFLIHVVVFVVLFADSVRILAKYDFDYLHRRMPKLITHLIYPEKYWVQGDIQVLYCAVGFFLAGLVIWRRPWLADQFCMYLIRNGTENDSAAVSLIVNGKGIGQKLYLSFHCCTPFLNHFLLFLLLLLLLLLLNQSGIPKTPLG